MGVFIVGVPVFAHAGIMSFVAGIFSSEKIATDASASVLNSQNMDILKAALNTDPNPAKGGGDITIVGGTALLSETGPQGTLVDIEDHLASSGQISLYVVRPGDSLSQIARMFNVSVNTVIWANDIRGSVIREGQTLVILPITGVKHTVVKGDTLESIAKKYKADLKEVLDFNNLPENASVAIGDTVVIPDGEIAAPKPSPSSAGSSAKYVKGASGPSYEGYYIRPIVGGRKTQGLHSYNGVDLAAPVGTPIMASASGTVIVSKEYGWNGGYGNYVVISHSNGSQTLYAHTNKNIVSVGQQVVKGQVVAYIGMSGRTTGPHVHFEIRGAKNPF